MTLNNILVIDDNEDILFALKMLLRRIAKNVIIEKDPRKIPFLLNHDTYDVILLDMNFTQDTTSGKEGFTHLQTIRDKNPAAKVIMITAYGDVEMAVKALRLGATDFVLKPWQNDKLIQTIQEAVNPSTHPTPTAHDGSPPTPNQDDQALSKIIGKSQAMQNVFTIIRKVAATDANVLILGENGTGKELIAQAIHDLSPRRNKPFVIVDMGAITETLFASELFGHKKGAFTDAKEDRAGRFEAAQEGTLFMDEIGNLTMPLQSKLLTVLQKRQVVRVGTNKPIPIDIRLICATNMHLHEMVKTQEFRQDLIYRINTVEIRLPPLREREGDIPLLANHFLTIYAKKYKQEKKRFSDAALKKLQKYHWPGNIRELQHAIERAVIMSEDPELSPGDFLFLLQKEEAQELNIQDYNLENVERIVIQQAITKYAGNISQAAKALGLTRASLYRRLEKYGL
ncbi:MAG: sigma-54-dependent transcriptional regulator [Bernardetiaceae bacterium]